LWRLRLKGLGFEVELDPQGHLDTSNLATGHVVSVSKATWERDAGQAGFSGFVELIGKPFVSNGPGTDVCHGVF
jgi:hypothetical protein